MSKLELAPYLNLHGKTRAALEFYHGIVGGELDLQTYGESPVEAGESMKDFIMHGTLKADGFQLMGADSPNEVTFGDSVHLSLMGADHDRLTKAFAALAEGGKVDMPLEKQFWGDTFGMLTDQFGIHWMVNIAKAD
jgi:PhnB protein